MSEKTVYLSPKQFAQIVGVSTSTVRRWEKEGAINSIRTSSGHRRFLASQIQKANEYKDIVSQQKSLNSKQFILQQSANNGESQTTPKPTSQTPLSEEAQPAKPISQYNYQSLLNSRYPFQSLRTYKTGLLYSLLFLAISSLAFPMYGYAHKFANYLTTKYANLDNAALSHNQEIENTSILGATDYAGLFSVNIPTQLNNTLTVSEAANFLNDINAQGQTLDLTDGQIIAPNVIYSLTAGNGIAITGGQDATISLAEDVIPTTFASITIGNDTITATSQADIFEIAAGDNITLSVDSATNKLTIASNISVPDSDNYGSWQYAIDGTDYDNINSGETFEFRSGNDITITRTSENTIAVALQSNIDTVDTINGISSINLSAGGSGLVLADGVLLDLSAITHNDSAPQGFKLPQNTTANITVMSGAGEGYLAWSTDENRVKQFDGSAWTDLATAGSGGSTEWTDAGAYLYPDDADYIGNNSSGGANKITGLYLADSASLTLGTDNDVSFDFSGSELAVTLGSNNFNFDANTLFIQGSTNSVGLGTTAPAYTLDVAGIIQGSSGIRTNSETITDFTGTGLTLAAGALTVDLGTTIEGSEITDGTIEEIDLEATNSPIDNYILSYDSSTGGFTWIDAATAGAIDGAGTAGYVTYWQDSNTLFAEQYLDVSRGGTGLDGSAVTAGQLLIGNGSNSDFDLATLTPGSGINITNGDGTITIASTLGTSISNDEIDDGTIQNIKLANSAIAFAGDTNSGSISLGSVFTIAGGTGISTNYAGSAVTVTNDGVTQITGTTNQITASSGTGNITLSLPQDIHSGASPTFAGLTIDALSITDILDEDNMISNSATALATQQSIKAYVDAQIGGSAQDLFSTIAVSGQDDIVADGNSDTLTFAAGANISLTTNETTDTLTIAATGLDNYQYWTLAGDSGSSNITSTGTATFAGGTGITTSESSGTLTIAATLGTAIDTTEITDATILENDLNATNNAGASEDNYLLSYDHTSGGFTWVDSSSVGHSPVTLAGSYDYLTLSGQEITLGQIDLTTDVTGTLPVANGGTGATTLNDLITLGTHTTGNYLATLADAGNGFFTVTGSGSETAAVTLDIADDSLNFAQFADALTLDASTDIAIDGTNVFSLTNTGTGNSFVVNDQATDTTPFVIDASGNVGIGTTAPGYALQVANPAGQLNIGFTSDSGQLLFRTGGVYGNTVSIDSTSSLRFAQSGTQYATLGTSTFSSSTTGAPSLRIDNNGAAAANPAYSFTGDTNIGMYRPAADTLAFSTSGIESLRIDSSNRIGIGTTAPAYKLDIQGTLGATGLATFGAGINVNSETITDLTGNGLTNNSGSLEVADNYLLNTGDTATGDYDFSGAVLTGASPLTFEGLTADAFETTLAFTDPTADRTITFQDGSGTVAFLSDISGSAHDPVTLAGSLDYLTLSDQEITLNAIDLTTDVTGTLPVANGGTGATSLNDLITLGTHTTGNYLATLADAGNGFFTVTGSGSETAAVTLDIADDSLNFAQFADALTLDASTDIAITGTNVLSLTNTGTGLSFLVNDQSTDTTPFAIDASGNVGIGTTAPGALLEVTTGTANTYSRLSGNGSLTLRNGNNATSLSVGQGGNYIVANTNLVAPGLYSSDSSSANRITLTDGSTGDITLRAGDTVIINDYNSGLEVARFNTDTGQVGIGTTAPSTLLDVAGTLRSTGLATFTSGINVNSETLTDFTGTGLINSAGSLSVADNYLLNSGDTATGNYNFSGAVLTGASPLTFEGLTADGFETTFAFTDPTADNTITFQDGSGTVAFLSDITAAAHDPVTLAGSYNYLTLSGQQITLNAIDLTTDVTGTLPIANGGTGATTLNDLITLGTHTTGNYVATIADSGSSIITVNNSGTETAAVTLGITADSLDFTEFKDALTLDASTDIALSTYDLSFGTNLLYLDSSTSRIGIGTTAPTETLEISGFTKLTSPNGANQVWKGVLAIQNLDVTGNSESVGLKIVDAPGVEGIPILIEDSSGSDLFRINPTGAAFYAPEGSVAGGEYVLQIINQDTTGGNQAGGLRVQSGPSSTTASALLIENQAGTDLLNIRPNGTSTFTGSLGIGTTAPAYTLDVSGIAQATSGFRTNSETVTDFTGTGLILSSGALTVDLGNTVQAYDAALTSIAGLTTSADQMIYTTGSDTYATTSLTAFARTLLDDADATTARTTLGLEIGTDVQAYNANTSLLGQTIEGSEITDNTIEEADLEVTSHAGAGQDGYILSYDNATGGFEWIANDGGSGGSLFTDSDTITYLTSATDDLAIGGTDAEAALFLDVSASMLTLNPFGTNSGETGAFVMQELEANGDNYTGFKAPDSITSNSVFTLPSGYASSANQVLASDTSGNLSWIDVSAGSGGFANWVINDGTTSQTIDSTQTLTIADSSTINGVVSATDTLTYNVIADSLNYTELSDSLVVDANTSINLYSGSADTSLRYYNSDASQELLYLDGATGRIGIGTTAPTSTLSLNGGTGSITTGLTFGDGDTGFYETSDDALYFEFGASSNKYLLQAGSILATAGGSNRGPRIMNEAPTATNPTLLAQGIDTTTGLGGGDLGEYLSLIVSGNEILRADNGTTILDIKNTSANSVLTILNTGSVGIGTTAPTTLLDVAGTLRATGLATFGSGINVNSETITDLTGAGLTNNAGSLEVADNYLLNTGDTATGDYDFSGAVLTGASPLTFEGTTADAFETTFAITDPTADRTITFQDGSGTVAFLSDITGAAHDAVTLAGSLDYLTLSDQEITLNAIDLTTDITGTLPVANGGTGATTLNDLITLGTHTTGNYVATIADSGSSIITVNNSGTETAAVTLGIADDSLNFTQFADALTLDASTDIALSTYDLSFATDLLFLDSSTSRVGIGTTAPDTQLTIEAINSGPGITLKRRDSGILSQDTIGKIDFAHTDANDPGVAAQIKALGTGGSLGETSLTFSTGRPLTFAERLRITHTGSVGIGTTAPTTLLDVAGTLRATGLATFGSGINVNSETITDLTGTGLTNSAGALSVADNYLLNTGDTATGDYDFSGAVLTGASPLTFEGLTADGFETTFAITDPTADNTITFQNASGTVAFLSDISGSAHDPVTLAGSLDYLTLSGQEITLNAIDLTTDVTGTLPVANGGTGATTLNDLITLGTHTTGNYIATIADSGSSIITVNNSGTESAAVTLGITDDSLDFAQFADALVVDADTSFNLYSGAADTDLRFYNSDASSELLFLDGTNSSIGIGTTAPTAFHSETDLQITDGDVTRITLAATDPVSDVVAVFDARGDGTNTVQLGSSSSHPLSFYTNNSRAMLIDTEGDIRIGALSTITGASEAIQLEGDGNYFSFDATSANPGSLSGIKFAEDTTTDSMSISYDGSGSGDNNRIFIRDESGGNNLVTFTRGGLVGIGITAPAASLHALDTTEQLRLGYNASNYSSFTISSGGDLTIDATGGDITLASGDNLNLSTASDLIFGGTTSLAEATGATDSGAYLVGIFDEFDNSSSSTVQDVIDDIDAAIGNRTYTADNYVTDGESITASIDALDQAISAVSGDVPNFDEVYAQSITDGNLTMEIDDTGGLIYNLTTTGDFILQDNGTAFAQFLDNGTTRFGQTDYAQFDTAGNLTFVDADTSSYIYGPTGGHIIMNLTNDIYFQTDGDTDDFLYLSTESNVPVIRTAGSSNLAIIPDGGQVDITGSLSTTGNITLTKADPAIIFNTATATDTDFWLGIREDAGGTDDDMFVIGDGTSPGSNQFVFVNTAGDVGIGDYPTSRLSSLRGDGGEQLRLLYDGSNYANFDVESDGSLAIDAIGSNSTVNFYDAIDITRTLSSTTSDNLLFPKLTNNTSSGSQYIGYFDNVGGTGTTEALLALDNSDSDTAVTTAIQIINAGGGFTNILDIAGTGLSATELGYIDGLNQSLSTSSNVTFGNITATGRLDLSAHNNNVGLNLPTNAGAPSAVTGTAEGDIVYDTTGDALYIYDGSSFTEIGGSAFSSFNTAADTGTGSITNGETLTINGGTNGIDTSLSGDTYTLNLDTTEIGSSIFGSGSPFIWIFNAGTTDPQIAFLDGQIAIGSVSALSMSSVTELNCTDCIDFDDLSDTLSLDTDTSISAGTGEELTYTKSFTNNTSENGFVMNFTASDTGAATTAQYGLYLDNLASTEALDASLVIDNSDADDAVGAAIRIVNAGGGFTNILDIAGTGLSATELGYIDGLNQSLSTSSNVTFGNITATGRLDLAAHTNNVGLNLPTNAGAPSAVTGTAEGDIVYDTTGDALYIYDGSAFTQVGGGGYAGWTYSLDSVSQDTIASGNTLNLSGGTGITLTDTGTRDFDIAINTTEIGTTTFGSGSGITWTFDAGATDPTLAFASNSLTIGSAATITASNTTTLTANSLATINTAAGLSLGGATSLTFTADNATINGSDAANGNLTLQGTSNATRTTSYLNLQPSGGLVGIGTTAPNTLLEVNNGSSTSNIRIASNVDTYLDLYADQDNNSAHDSVVRFYEGTTGRYAMGYDASANIFSIDSGSGLDDTNLLTLTSTGLGIGTTAPSTPLHIYHATNDTLATFQSGDSIARLQITDSADDAYLFTQSSKIGLGFESSLSTLTNGIVIDSTGVGIGTTAPAYKLDVNINASSTYAARIFNDQNTAGHGLLIQTDGTGNGSYPLHVSTGTTTDALVINGAGDLLLGSTDIAAANLAYDLSDNEFRANQAITFRPDGDLILKADDDTDDYLYLSTETNVPTLRTAGTSNLAIIPDGGQVNITGDLSLSGGDLIGAGNESIDLGEAIDGITFLVNSAAELSLSATSLYASTADGLQLGSTTNEFAALYLHDDTGINFGADQNFLLAYDETTDDALELGDGTNTFLRVTDNGTTGTLSMLDGNFLDLSAILHNDTAVQGFRLPNTGATPSNPVSGEGYLAWDATDNELLVYNGSSWATVSTGGGGTTWDAIGDAAANNTLNLGSYTTTFNFTGTTTTGWTYNTDSLTSGIGTLFSGDALTSGDLLSLTSTSTALTSGNLLSLDWSPTGSTEIFSTGDLFSLNIGQYGNADNLFAIYDNGSDVFTVSQNGITSAVPHSFTASGDVSFAYDAVFTNQTSSLIDSYGPLTISSGESFENNDLTLRAYGTGAVVIDNSSLELYTGENLVLDTDDSGDTYITHDSTNNRISFVVDGNEAVRFNNSGESAQFDDAIDTSADFDIAETYPTFDTSLKPGDLVMIDTNDTSAIPAVVKKANSQANTNILGIVSTSPAYTMGAGSFAGEFCSSVINTGLEAHLAQTRTQLEAQLAQENDDPANLIQATLDERMVSEQSKAAQCFAAKQVLIALAGRVPTKISNSNGDIKAGDQLILSSDKPGVAVKQTKAGISIGVALENGNGKDKVMAFVNRTYYDPNSGIAQINDNGQLQLTNSSEQFIADIVAQVTAEVIAAQDLKVSDQQLTEDLAALISDGDTPAIISQPLALLDQMLIDNDLTVFGETQLADTTINGSLTISGNVSGETSEITQLTQNSLISTADEFQIIANSINFNNILTINEDGDVQIAGNLDVQGDTTLNTLAANQAVLGTTTIADSLTITGSQLTVENESTSSADLNTPESTPAAQLATTITSTGLQTQEATVSAITADTIIVNGNTAGTITIPAGQTSITVEFSNPHTQAPIVTASALGHFVQNAVTDITSQGFTIQIPQANTQNLKFNWIALGLQTQ